MNAVSYSPARRRTLTLAGVATGIALVVATPLMASAHVHVDPGEVAAGSSQTLTFSSSHGCDGSPTTAFVVDIPEGVTSVAPVIDGAYSISRVLGSDGIATQVTYTALAPIEDGLKATMSMAVLFEEATANTDIAFPVTQLCEEGENAWIEVAEDGADSHDLDSPAPVVSVGELAQESSHDHDDAADQESAEGAEHTDDEHSDHADAKDASTETEPGSSLAIAALWLGIGGLAAGLAGLIVAIVRTRPSKS
ncbi:DUF1775 domain-containing protein [Microbacterium sp. R86528]|uniref:DUF1775 domain-containing protein n=1 Tax=Microbacterium sp. R86528 TaxID=3093864 RepID=UPI0037C81832